MISSRRNPLVKKLRSLADRKGREMHSLVLLEGMHLLEEALRTKSVPKKIVATSEWIKENGAFLGSIPKQILVQEVTSSVLEVCVSTINPDGVATLWPLEALPSLRKQQDFVLVLDRLQDPGNLGSILRTALAAEIDTVLLASGADPLSPKVVRSSAGAILHLPFERFGNTQGAELKDLLAKLVQLSKEGMQVVGTLLPNKSNHYKVIPYWELNWLKPTVLLLGNEGAGLHPDLIACCNHYVTLPHSMEVESLNVASAAVPLLLERQRAKMISVLQH